MNDSVSSSISSTTEVDRETLANGILQILKPAVEDVDQKVNDVRHSQVWIMMSLEFLLDSV